MKKRKKRRKMGLLKYYLHLQQIFRDGES